MLTLKGQARTSVQTYLLPLWHACYFKDTDNFFGFAAGTPYENGVFRMKLLLSHDFPHSPPKGMSGF